MIAARIVDKGRAVLLGQAGEYHYGQPDGLDGLFFDFTGIAADALLSFLETGADDEAVAAWITTHAKPRERIEIVLWNNRLRALRLNEAPEAAQLWAEDYIPAHLPKHRPVYVWFDIHDLEEGRL